MEGAFLWKDILLLIANKYAAPREALLLLNSCHGLRVTSDMIVREELVIEMAFPLYEHCWGCDSLVKKTEMTRHLMLGKCAKANRTWGAQKGFFCSTCRVPHRISWHKRSAHGPGRCMEAHPRGICAGCHRLRFATQLHILGKYCNRQCMGIDMACLKKESRYFSRRLTHYFGAGNFIVRKYFRLTDRRNCDWCARNCVAHATVVWIEGISEPILSYKYISCAFNCTNIHYCSEECKEKHWKWHQYECLE